MDAAHIKNSPSSPEYSAVEPVLLMATVIKYLLAILFASACFLSKGESWYAVVSILEILIIGCISNWLLRICRPLGQLFSTIGVALCLFQAAVYHFGNTYLSSIMVTNLDFIGGISGNADLYIIAGIYIVLIAFLPIIPLGDSGSGSGARVSLTACLLFAELAITLSMGSVYSPLYAYADLATQLHEHAQRRSMMLSNSGNSNQFYHDAVEGGRDKPSDLPSKPNIVLIFVEGLSQSIVEDFRGITPNITSYEQRSVNFTNYYNHTAATLRGLIGQLYSGYQDNNYDANALVSLPSILSGHGYRTVFINTEPLHTLFTNYLNNLGFDEVDNIPGRTNGSYNKGASQSLSDREAYDRLFERMEDLGSGGQPFLLSIYTYGTHASLKSSDLLFGDGTFDMANKFYDSDYWFGEFMKRYEASPLSENTIVVLTTDHCTYNDDAFSETFANYEREFGFTDRIPLFIYYPGVVPESIDADGRNSLDLAPSLLDYIDLNAPNYFLGQSLFYEKDISPYDSYSTDSENHIATMGSSMYRLEGDERDWFEDELFEYFSVASIPM